MNWKYKPSGEKPFYMLIVVLVLAMGLAFLMIGASDSSRSSLRSLSSVQRWDGWGLFPGAPPPPIKIDYSMEKQTDRLARSDFHLVEEMLSSRNDDKQVQPALTEIMKQLKTPVPFQK